MVATQVGVELESFERNDGTGAYRAGYDAETTSPGMAVVAAVVEAMDGEPKSVEPLQETIEVEALDEIFSSTATTQGDVHVSFVFEGRTVTVTGDGVVTVSPPGERPEAVPTTEGIER